MPDPAGCKSFGSLGNQAIRGAVASGSNVGLIAFLGLLVFHKRVEICPAHRFTFNPGVLRCALASTATVLWTSVTSARLLGRLLSYGSPNVGFTELAGLMQRQIMAWSRNSFQFP